MVEPTQSTNPTAAMGQTRQTEGGGGSRASGAARGALRSMGSYDEQEAALRPRSAPGGASNGEVEFGEDEEPVVGRSFALRGRSPYDVIQDHVSAMTTLLQQMKDGEIGAIQSFINRMQFSTSDEADPQVLGTIFSNVGRQIGDHVVAEVAALGGAAAQALPAGFLITPAYNLVRAVNAEIERAARAATSVRTANFLEGMRSRATATYQSRIASMVTQGPNILAHYRTLDGDEGAVTTGAKGALLSALDAATRRMPGLVPDPSAYQGQFIARYVNSRGGRIVARYESDDGGGRVDFTLESVRLVNTANSGHAADMLTSIMAQERKKVWELGVPVEVQLEGPLVSGGTGYTGFRVGERGPDTGTSSGIAEMDRRWRAFAERNPLASVARVHG